MKPIWAGLLCGIAWTGMAGGAELQRSADVVLHGDIRFPDNLSAVAALDGGQYLVVGADEGPQIQVLRRTAANEYALHQTITLLSGAGKKDEIDIEGIACSGRTVYVAGSHSRKRPLLKAKGTQAANRERLAENEREPLRESLFQLELDGTGGLASAIRTTSLERRIDKDSVLKPFLKIPGKENGVDIEGLSLTPGGLAAAFRSPVLREGFVPILFFAFDKPDEAELVYVNLDGRGARDITRVSDGFLLIGGPVRNEPYTFELYHWDGKDGVPGKDVTISVPLTSLGRIPLPDKSAKAEGLAVLAETTAHYDLLIVYDGVEKGNAARFRVAKRGANGSDRP